jgi:hypothetical protein
MLVHRLRDRHEEHAGLGELGLEGRRDRHGIEHGVDGDVRALDAFQHLDLAKRDAELLVGLQDLGIDVVERHGARIVLRRRVVIDLVVLDRRVIDTRPIGLSHRQPAAVRLQTPLEQPSGLVLPGRDVADRVLGEPDRGLLHLDLGLEPVLVLVDIDQLHPIDRLLHCRHCRLLKPTAQGRGKTTGS